METTYKTREEIKEAVKKAMVWDFGNGGEELLDQVTDGICRGKSVLIDGLSYMGNGKYARKTKDRYRYKLFVPIMDRSGNIYSTDLFQNKREHALNGHYGTYICTQQLVVDVIGERETDYRNERFDYGYKNNKNRYGQFRVELLEECEHCGGTGEVTCDESDGEGHIMNGVGTEKCVCQRQ